MLDALKKIFHISENINASIKDTPSYNVDIDDPISYSTKTSSQVDINNSMSDIRQSLNSIGRKAYEQVQSII